MRKAIASFVVLLVATGYVVFWCFRLMNMPRDDAYIGGITIILLWALFLSFVIEYAVKKYKQERSKSNEKQVASSGVGNIGSVASDRMHNEDRPRDGGNRS